MAEVVATELKRRSVLNWGQVLADVVERRPGRSRNCEQVYVHSIVVAALSDLRVRQFVVGVERMEISKLTSMIGTRGPAWWRAVAVANHHSLPH